MDYCYKLCFITGTVAINKLLFMWWMRLKYMSDVEEDNSPLIKVDCASVMLAWKSIVMTLPSLLLLIHLSLVCQFRVTFHQVHLQYLHLIILITWIRKRFLVKQVVLTLLSHYFKKFQLRKKWNVTEMR